MDFTEIKRHFNALMLESEAEFESRVLASDNPLKSAVQYAMMGNFIDFSALDKVEEKRRGMGAIICTCPQPNLLRDNLLQLPVWYV